MQSPPRPPRGSARLAPPPRALAAVGALAASYALARAAPPPRARLTYERRAGAEQCPDEGALRRAVASRLGYDPFHDDAPLTIAASIEGRRASLHARITRRDEQGRASGAREFDAAGDCEGLVATMAIAIGLAIDPFHAEAPAPAASPAPPPASPAPPPASPAPPAAPPPAPTIIYLPPPPAPRAPAAPAAPPADAGRWAPFLGFGALAAAGAAPRPTAGLRLEAGARRGAFSLGLEGRADLGASTDREGPDVRSSLLLATLAPCGHLGALALCALGSLGSLRGAGRDVDVPAERAALFPALGARAALELRASDRLSLRPHLDLVAPLRPVTLRVDGRGLWTTPPLSAALGASVALAFR